MRLELVSPGESRLQSLYRQDLFDRISVDKADLANLIQRHPREVAPLLQHLPPHLETGDLHELHEIGRDIQARIVRFEQF